MIYIFLIFLSLVQGVLLDACNGRTFVNSSEGVIGDGLKNYSANQHCEYLIIGL